MNIVQEPQVIGRIDLSKIHNHNPKAIRYGKCDLCGDKHPLSNLHPITCIDSNGNSSIQELCYLCEISTQNE